MGRAIAPIYGSVRGVTRFVGAAVDLAFAQLAPLLSERVPGPQRMAFISALNGVLGDRLFDTGSALALPMELRRQETGRKVLVLVHGSCLNDQQWLREGHDHGQALARDLGYTCVYVRYNSGRHISTNGRELASSLETLVAEGPGDVEELTLLGHSMGGLVIRSAADIGGQASHAWRRRLRRMAFLGAPHHGSPLERAGNWADFLLGVNAYSAPIGVLARIRSAGVTDLRYGNVRDEDWGGADRFLKRRDLRTPLPLPTDVESYAVAGTKSPRGATTLRGDGLVPVDSALGRHGVAGHALGFPESHCWIAHETDHLGLLKSQEVYETLRAWFATPPGKGPSKT